MISALGTVVEREPQNKNPNIPTGDIEISVTAMDTLAEAVTPPFPVDEDVEVDETLRLTNRAVDLRRDVMQRTLELRHAIVKTMRDVLDERDFLEIETPILTRSTPEGARDFLVPSRLQPGGWYALPQSPQLFKQLLMIAGYERYFQIARCFRDEDLRGFRQPEFTQLDLEMSFVEEADVIEVMEEVMTKIFALVDGFEVAPAPWPHMTYAESMLKYGNDKPDTRFGLEIHDVGELLRGSEFKVFEGVLGRGGVIRAFNAGVREMSRSELDGLNEIVQRYGAKAVAPIVAGGDAGWQGNLAKFFTAEQIGAVNAELEASDGDLLLFVADAEPTAAAALGALRLELGERFGLIPEGRHDVLWITEPPMFEATASDGLDGDPPSVHRADRHRLHRPGRARLARLRPRPRRRRDRRRLDPHPRAGDPGAGLRRPRHGRGGGQPPLRLPARRAQAGRAAARRHRDGHRPDRGDPRGPRLDPRRHRVPEDRVGRRSADRRAGAGRRAPAARAVRRQHRAAAAPQGCTVGRRG